MNNFCDNCPIPSTDLRDEQIPEAERRVMFELTEREHMQAGTYNRFVDGVYFERRDLKLSPEQRAAVHQCVAKRITGECVQIQP